MHHQNLFRPRPARATVAKADLTRAAAAAAKLKVVTLISANVFEYQTVFLYLGFIYLFPNVVSSASLEILLVSPVIRLLI